MVVVVDVVVVVDAAVVEVHDPGVTGEGNVGR